MKSQLLLIIDLGSSVIKAAVVDVHQELPSAILAMHAVSSKGLHRGNIVDQALFHQSLRTLFQAINTEHLVKVNQVKALISSTQTRSLNSQGIARVLQNEVTDYDIQRVHEIVKAIPMNENECVLHQMNQQYLLDYVAWEQAPLRQKGTRLECSAHLVVVKKALIELIDQTFKSLGMSDVAIGCGVMQSIDLLNKASDQGVAILDIGAGGCQLAVYDRSSVVLSDVMALGVHDILLEIENRFQCGAKVARVLFEKHASLSFIMGEHDPFIETQVGGEMVRIDRAKLSHLIQQGYQAVFEFVLVALKNMSGISLGQGLYIVGGGSAMPDLLEFAKKQLKTDDVKIVLDQYWFVKGAAKAALKKHDEVENKQFFPKLKAFWQVHF
ncbi:hypothetical protein N9C31_00985 [Gammaproteobacteria bacterium]|nr:hypothetical protein [Gammaproteobacteria bacterium]